MPGGPIVFLDKDGTLVENVPYNADPRRVRLVPGATDALTELRTASFRLVVISNQSGVAKGYFTESALAAVWERLTELLAEAGVALDGTYWCPHHPEGVVSAYALACDCRKPAPGLLLRAARELGADASDCWMIGDILDDVQAGRRAGCRTVLIDNGHETEWQFGPDRQPHWIVPDLASAARRILSERGNDRPPVGPD